MKIAPTVITLLIAILFQSVELNAAACLATSPAPDFNQTEVKESHASSKMERKSKRLEKRMAKWQKKLEKKRQKWQKKGKLGASFSLGFLGLLVMLIGGLFILLGLVIPVLGVLFLVIGIIIAFVGLLLLILLGSVSVDVSE